jgi:phage FluMu gp28-like protein
MADQICEQVMQDRKEDESVDITAYMARFVEGIEAEMQNENRQ